MSAAVTTSPQTLRELAGILRRRADDIEAADPGRRAHQSLSPEKLEELATMLVRGDRPTLGWWRRHLPSTVDHSECCSTQRDARKEDT
jgi:hypothetical protein